MKVLQQELAVQNSCLIKNRLNSDTLIVVGMIGICTGFNQLIKNTSIDHVVQVAGLQPFCSFCTPEYQQVGNKRAAPTQCLAMLPLTFTFYLLPTCAKLRMQWATLTMAMGNTDIYTERGALSVGTQCFLCKRTMYQNT